MAQSGIVFAKLFLEGMEVPFTGASINSSVNQASIAYIDLVPHQTINNIKPRTNVVIAVRDFNDPDRDFPFVEAWSGEVFGFNFSKTPTARGFTISAIDYSNHWDNVLAYYVNSQQSLGKGTNYVSNIGRDLDDSTRARIQPIVTTHSQASYFLQVMTEKLKESGADLLDGIIEIYKKISNINDFYQLAESRLRITERITMHSSGVLRELIEDQQALDWFTGVAGQRSGYATLRSVVQDLLSIIFHDFISVPFPGRVESSALTGKPLPTSTKEKKTIGSFMFKPNLYMIPPPLCNVFFPDEYSSFQFSRNFLQEPTRLIYRPEMPLAFGGGNVSLPHVYEPPSFDYYMLGKEGSWSSHQGVDDILVPESVNPGHYGSDDSKSSGATNQGKQREAQFLTNEERMKGILMAQERMVPATSKYRQALDDVGRLKHSQLIAKYLFYKKRYENRQLQITSHLKMSVIPGFTVAVIDDSDADQNVIAYCQSVTHRIYATDGGHTNVILSYPRTAKEEEESSRYSKEPIVPPWFSEQIFGKTVQPPPSEAAPQEVAGAGNQYVAPVGLAGFYKALIGDKGYKDITSYDKKEPTIRGAIASLLRDYRAAKKSTDSEAVKSFIAKITRRDYVRIRDSFDFIGAKTSTNDLRKENFVEFRGDVLEGKGRGDSEQIKLRRSIIEAYRKVLQEQRGFRG